MRIEGIYQEFAKREEMNAFIEVLIELSLGLIRFVIRNFRVFFALFVGAGFGLVLSVLLASYGGVSYLMILAGMVVSAVVIAPIVVDYINRLIPRK